MYVKQRRVTATCSSTGLDLGIKHPATTQDNRGRIAHYHYTGNEIPRGERRLKNLRRRRACCSKGSRRWERYNESIRQTSTRLTNIRNHQTVRMAKAIVGRKTIIGIEEWAWSESVGSASSAARPAGRRRRGRTGVSNESLSNARCGCRYVCPCRHRASTGWTRPR
ncbi:MAG: transposase [Acidobacteria bacterium]|nr:transposase [Acidobacteriota bacterium]